MDAKITKKRLGHLLSYDWLKIVGLILAMVLVWFLVFSATATKILPSQTFVVANYRGNLTLRSKYFESIQGEIFTHEVIEKTQIDMGGLDEGTAYQLLETRASSDELDVIFLSQEEDITTAYEETDSAGNTTTAYRNTYLESFLAGYRHKVFEVDKYLSDMEAYVGSYYENDALNKNKVEADFRARIERMKDKRYKTEAQIQEGLKGEIERIEKYKAALTAFNGYLSDGTVEFVEITYKEVGAKKFAVNLCPDVERMGKLSEYVAYERKYVDQNGQEKYKAYAEDMCVCFFDSNGEEESYRYEGLLYVVGLIQAVLAA